MDKIRALLIYLFCKHLFSSYFELGTTHHHQGVRCLTAKVKDWYFKLGINEWEFDQWRKAAAYAKVWGFLQWQEPKSEVTEG